MEIPYGLSEERMRNRAGWAGAVLDMCPTIDDLRGKWFGEGMAKLGMCLQCGIYGVYPKRNSLFPGMYPDVPPKCTSRRYDVPCVKRAYIQPTGPMQFKQILQRLRELPKLLAEEVASKKMEESMGEFMVRRSTGRRILKT